MKQIRLLLTLLVMLFITGCTLNEKETNETSVTTETTDNTEIGEFNLEIHFIDVGQGDGIFIQLPNDQTMLIDAGKNSTGDVVVNYLKNQGITKVDYLIGTHPDEDHIGGLDLVINEFNIGDIYLPREEKTTITFLDVLEAIDNKGLQITEAKNGVVLFDTQVDGRTLKAVMYGPVQTNYTHTNDHSAVIKLTYGTTTYLFTGDAELDSETDLLASGANLKADVLKVGHHGSNTSSSQDFLNAVDPQIGVISVGEGNSYSHPRPETIAKLEAMGIDIYRTDLDGTIVISSNGTEIKVADQAYQPGEGGTDEDDVIPVDPDEDTDIVTVDMGVVINEFMIAPKSPEFTKEFIELYNTTDEAIDISGYIIDDMEGGVNPISIPDGTIIEAKGFYVIEIAGLNNKGTDQARFLTPESVLIDWHEYTSPDTVYNQSYYRITDGGVWSDVLAETPTPNATNEINP